MTPILEIQAQIAKEITISVADKLRIIPASSTLQGQIETSNAFIRAEVCKLYEEVFNTVKRLTEE